MTEPVETHVDDHLDVVAGVREQLGAVQTVADLIAERLSHGGVLYAMGNGGSAADAQHLVGELIGRYRRERRPLAAVALSTDPTVSTCIGNDYSFDALFARQLEALATPDDVAVAFTSSGRSPNIVAGLRAAREQGALTVLLTGRAANDDGGPAAVHADHAFVVPSRSTARVQEAHVLLLHLLSEHLDRWAARTS